MPKKYTKSKPTKKPVRSKKINLTLPADSLLKYREVAKLAAVTVTDVINVILAMSIVKERHDKQ